MSALHDDCDEEEEDEDPYQHLYGHMLSSGSATPSQIAELKLQRRSKDTLTIVRKQLASTHYLTDPSVPSRTELVLSAAASLDSLHRREEAIFLLANNRFVEDDVYSDSDSDTPPPIAPDPSIQIALAKILFKQDRKVEALALTSSVMNGVSLSPSYAEPSDASDAFYLTGWIHIHNDNHTEAYKTWREGATALPESPELQRQLRKRECWDVVASTDTPLLPDLVPTAPVPTLASLKPFAVPAATPCPALSLYDPVSQNRNLVWRSTTPVLTPAECAAVLSYVQHHVTSVCGSNWPTVRKSSVKTTDVAVEDIPVLRPWLRALLKTRLFPLLNEAYPKLADGTSTLNADGTSRMRVHDAFIVRYDAEKDHSFHLPEHSDTSAMSFTVALNDKDEFEGGGTWFEALGSEKGEGKVVDAEVGCCTAFAGPMRHAGFPITKGVRMILVLFLYIEDFHYGPRVKQYVENMQPGGCEQGECKGGSRGEAGEDGVKPSGDKVGGFVVYRETVELSNMLGRIKA